MAHNIGQVHLSSNICLQRDNVNILGLHTIFI